MVIILNSIFHVLCSAFKVFVIIISMKLTFHGGAGSVTGANYLLESGDSKILIDCGLEQGGNFVEKSNFEDFQYDPKEVQAVFITHAHIDHVGRLPKLVNDGFVGTIYSTPPTKDFAELLLIDSQHVLRGESDKAGLPPLYEVDDIERVMIRWQGVPYHETVEVGPFKVTLYDAGHILGSAIIKVEAEGKTVAFSGDLGNYPAPIIHNTENLPDVDYLLIESTYGDRFHEREDKREADLEDAIEDAVKDGGVLMIPTFAMERTQELLYHMDALFTHGRVPKVPVFIDSPLAIKITAVYKKYEKYFNAETFKLVKSGEDILNFPGLRLTLTTEQSKEINDVPAPKIIIAGSGMSNGGRILHHEKRYLPDPKSTILFVGYQARGTLGRRIFDGEKEVRIFGETVAVNCKIRNISAYSAHADQPKLLKWVEPRKATLKKVFVIQGEEGASEVLAQKFRDEFAVDAYVPKGHEEVVL